MYQWPVWDALGEQELQPQILSLSSAATSSCFCPGCTFEPGHLHSKPQHYEAVNEGVEWQKVPYALEGQMTAATNMRVTDGCG